jgi:cysteine desulfurase
MECYLDNSATTRVFPEVADFMKKVMCEDYGNPSSMHRKGVDAENYVREAKEIFAGILKCESKNIYFTSGGTESDNLAIIGSAVANCRRGKHLITTAIEHPAVLNSMKYLEEQGYEVTYLPVDETGRIRLEDLQNALRDDTILVSIMHTNNEIGSLQPIREAAELIKEINPDTLFHVDAVQGFGKAEIYPKRWGIDLVSVSGHKIHGPKGTGVLYVGDGVKIRNISYGGGQQNNLRSGTENVPGIAGIAMAAKRLFDNLEEDRRKLYALKKSLIEGLREIPGTTINGLLPESPDGAGTAPHVISASFAGVRSEVVLHTLEDAGVYVSAGSACSSHKPQPSATLQAIGVEKPLLDSTIRFSLSVETTQEEIDHTLAVLREKLPVLQRYTRH